MYGDLLLSDLTMTTVLQRDNESSHLIQIQQALGLPTWAPDAHKEERRLHWKRIGYEFDDEVQYEQMSSNRIKDFCRGSTFTDWETSGRSAMLMLVGFTNPSISESKHYCWVSPLALDLLDRLESRDGPVPHASYLFPWRRQKSVHIALPVVLLQLLRHERQQLGSPEQREGLLADIYAHAALALPAAGDEKVEAQKIELQKMEALERLAIRVVRLMKPQETVYLVLDRVDQCWDEDHGDLMRILTRMIGLAACHLKILAIADTTTWTTKDRDIKIEPPAMFKSIVMKQRARCDEGY